MNFTDAQRLDFLEKWETSSYQHTWFTLLTQHVKKDDFPTLRKFCDYAMDFEMMIDDNGFDILAWHSLIPSLQERVISIWKNEARSLSDEEKLSIEEEFNRYWENIHQTGAIDQDK
jgi:hypothetical protein